ncbi:HTTM domain-containing protein [Jatrophihabitans sp. YIM 134969]
MTSPAAAVARWWFDPVPLGRIAAFRVLVYLFVPVDVALGQSWVRGHVAQGSELYQPLRVSQLLHLPTPTTASVTVVLVALLVSALVAATGRLPRTSGTAVAVLYLLWMLVAMSYGKVDHDRVAYLVCLAVLPTVGRARSGDATRSAAAGWALRSVQVAVVLTYFFSSWAKLRFGGWNWATGAILERALLRRSTPLSGWLIDHTTLLQAMQWAMITAEFCSPLLLLLARTDRARIVVAVLLWGFHISVFAGVTIIFLPHCIAIASFVPMERVAPAVRRAAGRVGGSLSRRSPARSPSG